MWQAKFNSSKILWILINRSFSIQDLRIGKYSIYFVSGRCVIGKYFFIELLKTFPHLFLLFHFFTCYFKKSYLNLQSTFLFQAHYEFGWFFYYLNTFNIKIRETLKLYFAVLMLTTVFVFILIFLKTLHFISKTISSYFS